jgi:hypothetical protein
VYTKHQELKPRGKQASALAWRRQLVPVAQTVVKVLVGVEVFVSVHIIWPARARARRTPVRAHSRQVPVSKLGCCEVASQHVHSPPRQCLRIHIDPASSLRTRTKVMHHARVVVRVSRNSWNIAILKGISTVTSFINEPRVTVFGDMAAGKLGSPLFLDGILMSPRSTRALERMLQDRSQERGTDAVETMRWTSLSSPLHKVS